MVLWGLHILGCIGDESRFRALAVPFAHGAQHDRALLLVMPDNGGTSDLMEIMEKMKVEWKPVIE